MQRDTRRVNPKTERLELHLNAELWLLTAAMNYIETLEPAAHHRLATRKEWTQAKRDVVTLLKAQIDAHLDVFEAEDAKIRATMRPA